MPSKIQPLLPSGPRPNLASVSPADYLPRSSRVDSSEIKVQVARGFRVAKEVVISAERIERSILLIRGQKVTGKPTPMRSQTVTASKRNIRYRPYAFTEKSKRRRRRTLTE